MQKFKNLCSPSQIYFIATKGQQIVDLGWLPSMRNGNTGVGYTYETMFGIKENNSKKADLFDCIEVKAHRLPAKSMLSLFTLSPKNQKQSASHLLSQFGQPNIKTHTKSLHTTIRGYRQNTYKKKYRFSLNVCHESERVIIEVRCIESGELLSEDTYYHFSEIEKATKKIQNLMLVGAKTRRVNGEEQFQYVLPKLYKAKPFDVILDLIEQGIICLDIRIGVYRSGKNVGKVHDHGAAFRIRHRHLNELFVRLDGF